jgi:TolB-like protein/class 3 adenylate cyclase
MAGEGRVQLIESGFMADERKAKPRLETGHVLFIDIVDYSKLLTDEQSEALQELNQIVRNTEAAREAEAAGKLTILPTGDGMALVFAGSVEEPVECALEISQALRAQPSLPVRMGIHSGPVHHVKDANGRENIAGVGINIAQRVMDCGDAGHILVSKRVADDLAQQRRWQPYLHELGDVEVKHGVVVSLVNLYAETIGNPTPPAGFKKLRGVIPISRQSTRQALLPIARAIFILAVLLLVLAIVSVIFAPAFMRSLGRGQLTTAPPVPAVPSAPSFGDAIKSAVAKKVTDELQKALDEKKQAGLERKLAGSANPEKSIAVLPFENLSDEKQNEYFADGVQDEILTDLAKIADLKVISRSSVMQYRSGIARNLRKIGEELGVAHVVEGSVQRAANKIRVNAQLIDDRTDTHLWAQTYDRDLADVFAIQSEIAKAIADQLQAKLSPNEKKAIEQPPTTDLAAFDLYTRAKSLLLTASFSVTGVPDTGKAIELLDEAVKRDPSFFNAYCQLAWAHETLYGALGDHTPARLALAEAALQAATRLRPNAAETHLARAQYLYYGRRDYSGALAELESVRRALPNDPRVFELTGYILRRRGQQEEGLRNLQRAVELDPRNFYTLQQIALSYQHWGRYAEAIAALDRAVSIVPDNVETRMQRELFYLFWKGDTEPLHQAIDAILVQGPGAIASAANTWFACALAERDPAAAERALVALGDNPCWSGEGGIILSHSFGEGLLARMTKDEARARTAFESARAQQEKIVQAQLDYGPPLCVLAMIDVALGHKEQALDEGRRAIALMPLEKDVANGSFVSQYFAITVAWTGDKELALQQLETGLHAPVASQALSYGALKLLPFWDPLRGDPRFEKIVTSLAPKESAAAAK